MEKAISAYLRNLIGEEGLDVIERLSNDEFTDQDIVNETGAQLSTVRRTLFTLFEHGIAWYDEKRDKQSGWIIYHWHIDFDYIQHRLDADAQKLIAKLERLLYDELNNVYYTCDNNCARFVFERASEYEFMCPICNTALNYQDNAAVVAALEEKIHELKADVPAIFYPENIQVLELALAEQE
ncbi:MAG: transcription factor [Euryarchaeota archaeon]|nr:transcription factor [Euryarchaeota archaeon]